MQVKFWGTRGSIPSPGPNTIRYGGNTSCVEVRSNSGTLVIIDCGTGLRELGKLLIANGPKPIHGYILITHTHWDHIQGIPFFEPLFIPENEWDIYAPRGFEKSLKETLSGQMQSTYFPISLDQLGANIRYHELLEGVFKVGDITVKTQYLNHTAITLGYRLEADGVSLVYALDHEPHAQHDLKNLPASQSKQDLHHVQFLSNADLVIHDAQYTAEEFDSKKGWGHSPVEYVIDVCQCANVKKIALTHHDPLREDKEIDAIANQVQMNLKKYNKPIEVFAAAEGQTLTLEGRSKTAKVDESKSHFSAIAPKQAIYNPSVLIAVSDPATETILMEAVTANGIQGRVKKNEASILAAIENPPSLIILEYDPKVKSDLDGLRICKMIREKAQVSSQALPIVLIANSQPEPGVGVKEGVSNWLIKPFSMIYARTHIHAWILQSTCKWIKAPLAQDEEQRLEALNQMKIFDTEPEERFDRLTRLASALFEMPIVLVTLLDKDRQWFKSCYGADNHETPREPSFCAHAIASRQPLIVADTLLDDRFADNPLVINSPRIRFYAGQPIFLPDGTCIGTLCLIDTRPRHFTIIDLNLLKDLAEMLTRELIQPK